MMFDSLFFIAPLNLIDEDTPDTTKFVTLAKIKKISDSQFDYNVYGNKDFLPKFNNGEVLTGSAESADSSMFNIEEALEIVYPVNEEEEPEPE